MRVYREYNDELTYKVQFSRTEPGFISQEQPTIA